ncbi:ChbG/HpnK family deacetylase [candidate division WWE3 bacterium]|nr:ChbG/HpnK family deacetylase [candidate division WWE3 bacterium]
MRKIILTADDFGFTENINKGIIESLEKGLTTELSLIVGSYGSEQAMKYARDAGLKNIGLHLSLFDVSLGEKPFRSGDYDNALENWETSKLVGRIEKEIKTFEDYFGFTPSHINSHKQIHLDTRLIDYVFNYVSKNNVFVRKWGDFDSVTVKKRDTSFIDNKISEYSIKTSDYLFGFEYDFENPPKATDAYHKLIENTKEGSLIEILFHPGYCGEFEASLTSFIKQRESDLELLCSNEFEEMLESYRIIKASEI